MNEPRVYCCVCHNGIHEQDFNNGKVADHKVFKLGELSYIELAHEKCAKEYNVQRPGYFEVYDA